MHNPSAPNESTHVLSQSSLEHAVVIGASMAGLLAARVLSDHFRRVTLIERDSLPEQAENRKGVPQGRHLHILQTKGEQIVSQFFPDLVDELMKDGATRIDIGADMLWFHFGKYGIRFKSGITQLGMSRPLLESHVRQRVRAIDNLRCMDHCKVVGLVTSQDHSRVTGVTVRPHPDELLEQTLDADFVIDATGRGSHSPVWLESIGYPKPKETAIKVDYGYTSRIYRQNPAILPNAKALYIMPTPPDDKRLGGVFPIEGGRWLVVLGGYHGFHAPANEQGFLAHAKHLATPEIYQIISQAEPLSDFVIHTLPSNLRRHYEQMLRFPDGFLAIGDAMCSFNPIYGQGMSVCAMEAEILDRCLSEANRRNTLNDLAKRYFKNASKALDGPWAIATGEDFRYAGIEGEKPFGTNFINWYIGQVHQSAHTDHFTTRALLHVLTMTRLPSSLFHPRVAFHVLKDRLFSEPVELPAQNYVIECRANSGWTFGQKLRRRRVGDH